MVHFFDPVTSYPQKRKSQISIYKYQMSSAGSGSGSIMWQDIPNMSCEVWGGFNITIHRW